MEQHIIICFSIFWIKRLQLLSCVLHLQFQLLNGVTRELSTEQRVSCSKVIPLLNAILFELCKNVVDDDETQVPDDDEAREPVFLDLVLKIPSKSLQV